MDTNEQPLVSVLMPVRNGEKFLGRAIDSVISQSYWNLEVIISNNHSTDSTQQIIDEFKKCDSRITTTGPPEILPVWSHLHWLAQKAKGRYLCFAAHDDLRDLDFVESLLISLINHPAGILAFGDLVLVSEKGERAQRLIKFETVGLNRFFRVRKVSMAEVFYFYGIWRTEAYLRIPLLCSNSVEALMFGAALGEYIYVPGSAYYYFDQGRSGEENEKHHLLLERRRSAIHRFFLPVRDGYKSLSMVDGRVSGAWAALCIFERQIRRSLGWLVRRLQKQNAG